MHDRLWTVNVSYRKYGGYYRVVSQYDVLAPSEFVARMVAIRMLNHFEQGIVRGSEIAMAHEYVEEVAA
jgi:hypothetical protein